MIDFKLHIDKLKDALAANKELLKSSNANLAQLEATILQKKDKFTPEQLEAFEKAKKEADKLTEELKKHGV
jgi:multidrug resistance efflux pump